MRNGPKEILRIGDGEYIGWSDVVDAPVTTIVNRAAAVKAWGSERVERADGPSRSSMMHRTSPQTAESLVAYNRAGPRETVLTLDEIRERFREDWPGDAPESEPYWQARREFQVACMEVQEADGPNVWHQILSVFIKEADRV